MLKFPLENYLYFPYRKGMHAVFILLIYLLISLSGAYFLVVSNFTNKTGYNILTMNIVFMTLKQTLKAQLNMNWEN